MQEWLLAPKQTCKQIAMHVGHMYHALAIHVPQFQVNCSIQYVNTL